MTIKNSYSLQALPSQIVRDYFPFLLQKENLKQQITNLQKESGTVGKQLQDKYGEGTIDVSSGEFTKSS